VLVEQAVQLHGDQQLGRTRPVWGSRPVQAAAGQLGQASARRWPASGSSSPSMATMPSRWAPPASPAGCAAVRCGCGRCRVGDQPQMGDDPAQAGWVKAAGGLHQDRFGLGRKVGGQVLHAVGQHPGMGQRQLPVGQGPGGLRSGDPGRGPGDRTQLLAVVAPMRSRRCSQPAVEPARTPWSAPAAPRASRAASSRSHWPSRWSSSRRSQGSVRPGGVGQPGPVLGGQPVDRGRQRGQLVGRLAEWVFGCMTATYQAAARRQAPTPIWGQPASRATGQRHHRDRRRATPAGPPWPGGAVGQWRRGRRWRPVGR
jgi:hypothetical protein